METSENDGVLVYPSGNGSQVLQNRGVFGDAESGVRAYGLYGEASGASTGNVGVYGVASGTNAWAGYFNGSGFLRASSWTYGSDLVLKTNVQDVQGALEIIEQLKPRSYDYNQQTFEQLNLPSGNHFGFIAQEVEEAIPSVGSEIEIAEILDSEDNVINEAFTIKGIRQTDLVPLAIGAIMEQQVLIENQKESIDSLNSIMLTLQEQVNNAIENIALLSDALSECCAVDLQLRNMEGNDITLVKEDTKLNFLYRNNPNPFVSSTILAFSLVEGCNAKIMIYKNSG